MFPVSLSLKHHWKAYYVGEDTRDTNFKMFDIKYKGQFTPLKIHI
jgi:hypothetical protein